MKLPSEKSITQFAIGFAVAIIVLGVILVVLDRFI